MSKAISIMIAVFLALAITSCGKPEAVEIVEKVAPKKAAPKISPKPLEPLTLEEFHKGIVYTSWSDSELGSPDSDSTLVYLEKIGVRHVAIMIPTYQKGPTYGRIVTHDFAGGDTPTDKSIRHAIKACHLLGMKVMLKPHVDCLDGKSSRGDIVPSDRWFASYKNMILRYARLAAANNVEIFSIGAELEGTTVFGWEAKWREVIASVKEVYDGYLVYSASWPEYEDVPFWDLMDFIGINAYFPLTDKSDPTKGELINAWNGIADKIGNWLAASRLNKGVIFTELGYVSSDGTNKEPWAMLINREDQEEQADCLDAALGVLSGREWFRGMYLWQYFPQDRWNPLGFSVRGKKAEEVLKKRLFK